ncbi:hypothetical protein [Myceligenerans indicum]|uniref:Uncharacterized protein n=1 Tax=Myceligenerans indicum TaxID=2593663 RepID=A0ABS1LGS2_9MICO|nr:hypothetical protein [Myceligenerans indicum]MBL0885432.1 hypothetical protein [Myceligenerans indicum]
MTEFTEAINRLAQNVDADKALEDEHARWRLYEAAARSAQKMPIIYQALRFEGNELLLSATVIHILPLVVDDERADWVDLLPQGRSRDYAARRATELHILEARTAVDSPVASREEINNWSQWLQLRIAERSENTDLLSELSEVGTTKRIRHEARQRVRSLTKGR